MTPADFFSLLSAASLFAIALAFVPALLQLRRTLRQTELMAENLNRQLEPMCTSISEAAREVQITALTLGAKVDETESAINAVRKSAEILLATSGALKEAVRPVVTGIGGISAGVLAFSHFLNKSWKKTGKGD